MSLPTRFHPEARLELLAESAYYERQVKGLGARFVKEVEQAVGMATRFPGMGAPFKHGTQRVFPKRFPFSVVYRVLGSEIVVIAIVPDARKPGYWRERRAED